MRTTNGARHLKVAVGAVVHEREMLFVRRVAPDVPEYDGRWELPGGKIEKGETAAQALTREVREEAGFGTVCQQLLPMTYTAHLALLEPPLTVHVRCGLCELTRGERGRMLETPELGSHETIWLPIDSLPFSSIIPGSREFTLWTLDYLGEPIPPNASLYKVQLESIADRRSRSLGYELRLRFEPNRAPTPFIISTRLGRVGRWSRPQESAYDSMASALDAAMRRVRRHQADGYHIVRVDETHPLRSWLVAAGVPMSSSTSPTLFDSIKL